MYYGTAFFVSDRRLVTAGHNAVGLDGKKYNLLITHPGLERLNAWQVLHQKVPTIKCKIVATMYGRHGGVSRDIAILETESFVAINYLRPYPVIPAQNMVVTVIGYPNEIKREWLETLKGLSDISKAKLEATRLFKGGNLIASQGTLESCGSILSYHISTCPGMGGSCVLYRGMIIGRRSVKQAYYRGPCRAGR
jgi:V8-like Glu-specific endopeptidase